MKSTILKSQQTNGTVNDGDNGNSQRAAMGEIEKVRKVVEILESVVLPTIVDSQNAQNKPSGSSAAVSSDPIKIIPKGLKLLQHHSAITTSIDDGAPMAADQKPNPQSNEHN